jgi:hypothetical protein
MGLEPVPQVAGDTELAEASMDDIVRPLKSDPYRKLVLALGEASEQYLCGDEPTNLPRGMGTVARMAVAVVELINESLLPHGVNPEPLRQLLTAIHAQGEQGLCPAFFQPVTRVQHGPTKELEDCTPIALAALAITRQVEQGIKPYAAAQRAARSLNTGTGSVCVTPKQLLDVRNLIAEGKAPRYVLKQYEGAKADITGPLADQVGKLLGGIRGRAAAFRKGR